MCYREFYTEREDASNKYVLNLSHGGILPTVSLLIRTQLESDIRLPKTTKQLAYCTIQFGNNVHGFVNIESS